jgi:GH25 family lysozyme M1 (1,4-beta-N-acetylmuramidase)
MAIHFIDIASYQAGLDLRAAAAEIDGVIIKVTEGTGYVNPSCDKHWGQACDAGLLCGFYHFAGNSDPVAEADYFMQHAAGYFGSGVPVLDWEGNQDVAWVNAFVRRVHDVKGVWCWIYANPWRFNQGGVEQNCMRWVAAYPAAPSPTFAQAEGWDAPSADGVVGAWQFASDGRLSCWGGNLDFDLFYGDAAAWRKYAGAASAQHEGWIQKDGRWWYRHADGSYTKSGWEKIDGKWYLFDADGWMLTGWQQVGGKWYYLTDSGAMATGWVQDGGKWYYLDPDSGAMHAADVQSIGGKWYAFGDSGEMHYGVDSDASGALKL